jgi:hypothetical protein
MRARLGGAAMLTALTTAMDGNLSWALLQWEAGTAANGFQGAILESPWEFVCAFKGSQPPGKTTAFNDWLVNDRQIALNQVPQQTGRAKDMVDTALQMATGYKPVSIVGHSLGGGLAQLVGFQA